MARLKAASGFSLIELIIVIALIGILLAIAAPNFSIYRDNTNLKEAARDISSDIAFYKQKSIAENLSYKIVFNASLNTYTISQETSSSSGTYTVLTTKAVSPGNVLIVIYGTPSYSDGIIIQPRGTMTSGSLVLQHTRRLSTATINTYTTGRVNVQYSLKS